MKKGSFAAITAALLVPGLAGADVQSKSAGGFVVSIRLPVAAPPTEVYAKFFEIGKWWSDDHTYSGKASNLSLKNQPGGCFCEVLARGGFVRHATVEYSTPDRGVHLQGALGPLQELGAHGVLVINFYAPGEKGVETFRPPRFATATTTELVLTYHVSGYLPAEGYAPLAEPVDTVLREQMVRFKRFIETGKPAP